MSNEGLPEQPRVSEAAPFEPERFLAQLTTRPGVYQMKGDDGETLYVGKARNLRNRVTSYFRASGLSAKTMAMVARIRDVHIIVTNSDTEALLLEQSLIKELRPHYNIVLRDDKSYPFIHLTADPDFPRLTFHRGAKQKQGRYFGPYPSAYAVRNSLNQLQKLFQLRNCDDAFFRNRSRPCLQYQIQRCSGPCVGLIAPEDYRADVARAVQFLDGRGEAVLEDYRNAMERAAEALAFEKAARLRDQMLHLRRVQEEQFVHAGEGNVDLIVVVRAPGGLCVQVQFIRRGQLLGHRNWFPADQLDLSLDEALAAFASQFYLGGGQGGYDMPRQVILDREVADADVLAEALSAKAGRRVTISSRVRGQRARWLDLATASAEQALSAHLSQRGSSHARFEALREALGMDETPQRLECFDISHSSGEATVASCVVFDTDGPKKSDYRRFNIEGVTAGDDFAAMEQALERRYKRLRDGEGTMPDILLVDGGKGQLTQAERVLAKLGIEGLQVVAVAKGSTRRAGLETLILADTRAELELEPTSPALHLIQHIRDEAHRFAITGHRARRGKKRLGSELDAVPGIGPKRKRELLRHFGSLSGLRGASMEAIAKVPGINDTLAATIYGALHND